MRQVPTAGRDPKAAASGLVDTVRHGAPPRRHAASATLLGRGGEPREIAAAAAWLRAMAAGASPARWCM